MYKSYVLISIFLFKPLPTLAQSQVNLPKDEEYELGGKDVLKITVYGEPDLERTVRVSRHGTITFPLIGEVSVEGMTASQVEDKLAELLGHDYLVNPHVSVFVEEFHSKEVYILGAVNKSGAYPLLGRANLLEMLSQAGGIDTRQETKRGKNLVLIRTTGKGTGSIKSSDESETLTIDLEKLLKKGDPSLNLALKSGDIIYLPTYGRLNLRLWRGKETWFLSLGERDHRGRVHYYGWWLHGYCCPEPYPYHPL